MVTTVAFFCYNKIVAKNMKQPPKEPTVSVVLIVRDDKHNMKDFFCTIEGIVDELIVLDNGSIDGTFELVEELAKSAPFPVRLIRFIEDKFNDGRTRQHGADIANCEYIFELDADERLSDGFKKNLKHFLREKKPIVATIPRIDELVPHFIDIMNCRLFHRNSGARYTHELHSKLLYSSPAIPFKETVLHMQGKNHWLRRPQRILGPITMEIDDMENTRGLSRQIISGIRGAFYKFNKVYFRKGAWKDGKAGLKFAFLKGLNVFLANLFIGLKPRSKKQ